MMNHPAVFAFNLICIVVYTPMTIKALSAYIWCWMTGSNRPPLHDVIMPAICVAMNVITLVLILNGTIK